MFGLMDQWDKYLEDFSTTGAWLPHRYRAAETTRSLALMCHTNVISGHEDSKLHLVESIPRQ